LVYGAAFSESFLYTMLHFYSPIFLLTFSSGNELWT
jgi:hypothetical protein